MANTRFVKPNGTRIKNRIFTPIAKATLKRTVLMVAFANRIERGIVVRSPDKRVTSEDSIAASVPPAPMAKPTFEVTRGGCIVDPITNHRH